MKMRYVYKLLAGGHREIIVNELGEKVKQDFVRGDLVTTDRQLDKLFGRNKFELVETLATGKEPESPAALEAEEAPAAARGDAYPPESKVDPEDLGTLVTEQYEGAEDLGVEVYEKGGWCSIYRDDKRINSKALRKNEVSIALENLADAAAEAE